MTRKFRLGFSINKINLFNDSFTIACNYSRCTRSIRRYTVAVSVLFSYNVTTMVITDAELFFGDAKREVHKKNRRKIDSLCIVCFIEFNIEATHRDAYD